MLENIKNKKIAVVLLNLGGPDSLEAVRPFLFNLFSDKYIIKLPLIFRYLIAGIIAITREKTAKNLYSLIGGKSPILENTVEQKQKLEIILRESLNCEFKIFISMRHWHPMSAEVAKKVASYDPAEIILLPLYPQFSTTTSRSSIEDFKAALKKREFSRAAIKTACCYWSEEKFIASHVELIKKAIGTQENYRILFSAHGLPEKIIKEGDPYQWQIENTVSRVVSTLAFSNLDYKITYQSRVGPLAWIGPNTEDEVKLAGEENKNLIIVPIAFVSEHVETLVELDLEYKKIADSFGIRYTRVPALGTDDNFIKCLADLVVKFTGSDKVTTSSNELTRKCPGGFTSCICQN